MAVLKRLSVAILTVSALSTGSTVYAQFGNSASVQNMSPQGLSGVWILRNITMVDGSPMTVAMKASIQNTRLNIVGQTSGTLTTDGVNTIAENGAPAVVCRQTTSGPFTTGTIGFHKYLRMAASQETAGRDCRQYAGKTKTYPAVNVMYEQSGDILKTLEFSQNGVIIYTYARGQIAAAPVK